MASPSTRRLRALPRENRAEDRQERMRCSRLVGIEVNGFFGCAFAMLHGMLAGANPGSGGYQGYGV